VLVADGTYDGFVAGGNVLGSLGASSVAFVGNVATPSNVLISAAAASAVVATSGAQFTISGAKLTATGTNPGEGICLWSGSSGTFIVYNIIDFGFCEVSHIEAELGTVQIMSGGTYFITGGASQHAFGGGGGLVLLSNSSITITGTPGFANAFAVAIEGGVVEASNLAITGTATGSRFAATLNGVVNTGTGNANYLPGDAPGSTATGGAYN
jgi:hypothetical protein